MKIHRLSRDLPRGGTVGGMTKLQGRRREGDGTFAAQVKKLGCVQQPSLFPLRIGVRCRE
jgi:hypothetical protein